MPPSACMLSMLLFISDKLSVNPCEIFIAPESSLPPSFCPCENPIIANRLPLLSFKIPAANSLATDFATVMRLVPSIMLVQLSGTSLITFLSFSRTIFQYSEWHFGHSYSVYIYFRHILEDSQLPIISNFSFGVSQEEPFVPSLMEPELSTTRTTSAFDPVVSVTFFPTTDNLIS